MIENRSKCGFAEAGRTITDRRCAIFRLGAAIYTTSFHDRAALLDDFAMTPAAPSFTIDTRLQSDLVRDLISGRLDAALLMGNAVPVSDEDTWENEIGAITNETQYPESLSRVVIGTRPVGLLIPVQSPLANKAVVEKRDLMGQSVAMLGHEHGHALIDPLQQILLECGASIVKLADGNALAIEDYASRQGICAIGIGWFPPTAGLVLRRIEGFDVSMDYSLVLGQNANRAAGSFFNFAREWRKAQNFTVAS